MKFQRKPDQVEAFQLSSGPWPEWFKRMLVYGSAEVYTDGTARVYGIHASPDSWIMLENSTVRVVSPESMSQNYTRID